MSKKTTPKKLDPVKRVKTTLKFARITLITATDEIIPLIKKYGEDVKSISYTNGTDLELREKTNE